MGSYFPPLRKAGLDNPGDRLSLAHLTAEALAERFQQRESPTIWNEIERRFRRWREGFIRTMARAYEVPPRDWHDAQQEAAVQTREALRKFPVNAWTAPGDFACFLRRRIASRFVDLLRSQGRISFVFRLRLVADIVEDAPSPLDRAIANEESLRLNALLRQLSEQDRRLLHGRAAHQSRKSLAAELGLSEKRLRTRESELFAWLRRSLLSGSRE